MRHRLQEGPAMQNKAVALLLSFFLSGPALSQPPPPPAPNPPPLGCNTPESHQFDFWLGKWEVHPNGVERVVAHSLIEKKYTGCAVRENWMPLGKELTGGGGSLNLFDKRKKVWRQAWLDSTGTRVDFEGGLSDGVMTLTGAWADFAGPGRDALVRMHYQKQPDGEVRQWAEASRDDGKTWIKAFDLLYRHVDELPAFK
jgi:hypothetical protein